MSDRFPCAGCGRKTPVEDLKPVSHGVGTKHWWLDKRCPACRREPPQGGAE